MKNQLKLLYVLGALMLTCMSFAETPEKGAEAISAAMKIAEMKIIEAHLHKVQRAAKKVDRIFLVVNEITNTSGAHPQGRCLRYALEGELLERVREIVGCLKVNPNYTGPKQNPIFEKWSAMLEIDRISGSSIYYYTPDGEKKEAYSCYCILAETVGPDATSRYYLDAEKTSELRMIIGTIWKDKTGQDPPSGW